MKSKLAKRCARSPATARTNGNGQATGQDKRTAFLKAFSELGNMQAACIAAGVGRRTVYRWISNDPLFAHRFEDAGYTARTSLATQSLKRTEDHRVAFLKAFAELGTVQAACQATGVSRRTPYRWIEADQAFAEEFEDARQAATDVIEAEVRRRGKDGIAVPVFHQGVVVGHVQKYSDACLLAILNAYRPERFRRRREVSAKNGGPLAVAVVKVSYDFNMKPDDMP